MSENRDVEPKQNLSDTLSTAIDVPVKRPGIPGRELVREASGLTSRDDNASSGSKASSLAHESRFEEVQNLYCVATTFVYLTAV